MKITTLLLTICLTQAAYSQQFSSSDPAYIEHVQLGEAAMLEAQYDSCLYHYKAAFEIKHTSVLSTLRATCCAYRAGDYDLLQHYLDKAMELDYEAAQDIFTTGSEFDPYKHGDLHEEIDMRWSAAAIDQGLNLELIGDLRKISKTDQEQRQLMHSYSEEYDFDSPQMDSLWALQSYHDSINTHRIREIISEHGYPGRSLVGSRLASTAFLVIQHSDHETQTEYLPIIQLAADDGELRWSSVALLIDRVRLGNGEPQLYGSQIYTDSITQEYYFGPIAQPEKVDSMRASVGLGPLDDYAQHWDFDWDATRHKARHKMQ